MLRRWVDIEILFDSILGDSILGCWRHDFRQNQSTRGCELFGQ